MDNSNMWKEVPTYDLRGTPKSIWADKHAALAICQVYLRKPEVQACGAVQFLVDEEKLDQEMLQDYWQNSIGTVDQTTWECRGKTKWLDCEGSHPVDFENVTYEEFKPVFEAPAKTFDKAGIQENLASLDGMPTLSHYYSKKPLHNPSMVHADKIHNPLKQASTPASRKWKEESFIAMATTMLSLAITYTGFHFEDCGFFTFCRLLYGGVKIWFIIAPDKQNVEKFLELVNSKARKMNRTECKGILGTKSYGITPTELEKAGIKFSVAYQREGMILLTTMNVPHAVLTLPPTLGPPITVLHAVNFITTNTSDVDQVLHHYKITKCPHKKKKDAKSKNDREHWYDYSREFTSAELLKVIEDCEEEIMKKDYKLDTRAFDFPRKPMAPSVSADIEAERNGVNVLNLFGPKIASRSQEVEKSWKSQATGRISRTPRTRKPVQSEDEKEDTSTGSESESENRESNSDEDSDTTELIPKPKRARTGSCDYCERKFPYASWKRNHMITCHPEAAQLAIYMCNLCPSSKKFVSASKLTRHMDSHKDNRIFGCTTCGAEFRKAESFTAHQQTTSCGKQKNPCKETATDKVSSYDKTKTQLKCKYCPKIFKHSRLTRAHMLTVHPEAIEMATFVCTKCPTPKGFNVLSRFSEHLESHRANTVFLKERPFNCVHCSNVYAHRRNLDRHVKLHHSKIERKK